MNNEEDRILQAYLTREKESAGKASFYGYENHAHLFRIQERHRETLNLLSSNGLRDLSSLKILDVGCGDGGMLRQFLQWGAEPANLAGIELRSEQVELALSLNPLLDIRPGSAARLPWGDGAFDLVCQHTVFTSILDQGMRVQVSKEMIRVLKEDGHILWYDFMYDNPANPDVLGIGLEEIKDLFRGLILHKRRITLAPPIARRIPNAFLPLCYPFLASIKPLCTHYLILLSRL